MNAKVIIGLVLAGGALAFFLLREAPGPADASVDRSAGSSRAAGSPLAVYASPST